MVRGTNRKMSRRPITEGKEFQQKKELQGKLELRNGLPITLLRSLDKRKLRIRTNKERHKKQ